MTRTCPTAPPKAGVIRVGLEIVPIGASLFRFHSISRAGFRFNPNIAADGLPTRMEMAEDGARFNPFPGRPSTNVPTLYVGSTMHAAARESVFHDVPHEPDPTYSSGQLRDYAMTSATLNRAIKVLLLVNNQLKQVPVPGRPTSLLEDEIIHTLPDQSGHPQLGKFFPSKSARHRRACVASATRERGNFLRVLRRPPYGI
jgi:hypothetical protein